MRIERAYSRFGFHSFCLSYTTIVLERSIENPVTPRRKAMPTFIPQHFVLSVTPIGCFEGLILLHLHGHLTMRPTRLLSTEWDFKMIGIIKCGDVIHLLFNWRIRICCVFVARTCPVCARLFSMVHYLFFAHNQNPSRLSALDHLLSVGGGSSSSSSRGQRCRLISSLCDY